MYKYLDENGVLVLENGTLKFSTARSFNDPFELSPVIDDIATNEEITSHFDNHWESIVSNEYDSLPKEFKNLAPYDLLKQIAGIQRSTIISSIEKTQKTGARILQKKAHTILEELVGILCLTENENSHLMWAHYANSHKGLLIEFDTSDSFFDQRKSEADSLRHLVKVDYQAKRKRYTLSHLKEEDLYTVKDIAWSYENEWRMMVALKDADENFEQHGNTIHLFKFPFRAIKRVILGANSNQALEKRVIDTWHKNFSHAKIYKAEVDHKEYILNYEEIKI